MELCPNSSQSPTKLREVDPVGKLGLFNLVATESSLITVINGIANTGFIYIKLTNCIDVKITGRLEVVQLSCKVQVHWRNIKKCTA